MLAAASPLGAVAAAGLAARPLLVESLLLSPLTGAWLLSASSGENLLAGVTAWEWLLIAGPGAVGLAGFVGVGVVASIRSA